MDSAKPMGTQTALMGHKTRQSCDYGKEICKGRSGDGGWQQWEESKGGWAKSNQNALYTCMKLPKNKMYSLKKKLIQKKHEM